MAAKPKLYNTLWRWHFYAGLLILPIMPIMAVTGGIYLFEDELENALYSKYFYNGTAASPLAPVDHDAIISVASAAHENAQVKVYRPAHRQGENARVTMALPDQQQITTLINPVTLAAAGTINDNWRLTVVAKKIHGGLMAGTPGEVLVELVACWTIIMVMTGLYLWWPRVGGMLGAIIPRVNQSSRILWRDLHAIPGFLLSLWILVIIGTGLPWSVVWGGILERFAVSIGEEFPQEIFSRRPNSEPSEHSSQISMNRLIDIAHFAGVHGFEVQYPWGPVGSFAIMPGHHNDAASKSRYLFIDQFSGEIILDIDWSDIGAIGKATSWGVALHEGRLFGISNQLANLAAVIVLVWMAISGLTMWLLRKPKTSLGAPKPADQSTLPGKIIFLMVILGIALPLAGITMLIVWSLDKLFELLKAKPV
jgi:uncharacterized iron-regulated membrane protein